MLNISDHMDVLDEPDYEQMAKHRAEVYCVIGILSFLSIMGTAGNALVLYVFYQKKDKQVSTLFIIVLAFVDFTTCIIVIPYTIILESLEFILQYDALCKLYQFLITSNIPFSALIMVAIAIDRYFCICHPFLHALNLTRAKLMTLALGMFSASLGVIVSLMYGVYDHIDQVMPHEMFNGYHKMNGSDFVHPSMHYMMSGGATSNNMTDYEEVHGSFHDYGFSGIDGSMADPSKLVVFVGQCRTNELVISKNFRWYYQKFYTVLYFICLMVVIILYSLIYRSVLARRTRRARQRSKALPLVQLQNNDLPVHSAVEETLLTQVNGDERHKDEANGKTPTAESTGKKNGNKASTSSESSKRKSVRKDNNRMANLKTAAMLFVVTVVFIITFLPAFLMALELIPYNMVVFYMYFANNVANPVIYSFMNKNFRDDLKKIFCSPQVR